MVGLVGALLSGLLDLRALAVPSYLDQLLLDQSEVHLDVSYGLSWTFEVKSCSLTR